ncbi:hypothetical protein FO440_03405 [Mucilaginibacter corticis]|uniref:Uncharacterized protein n=1 Tax=Mucilaginibacter corticis TaxID=2597670 RepID=A0A556MTJ1_9SPHI|nr:hypothetical protein [Mucilaginibacter corticis]TSJ43254.1 hypothetical protein FO440_03405 [Mucilaginibacter corticis]
MKTIKNLLFILPIAALFVLTSCSKKKAIAPAVIDTATTIGNFYYGSILGSPNTIIGPGNAILLRNNGTMREYANDYYSLGTSIAAKDTASAKIKIDGTYTVTKINGVTTITAIWYLTTGSPALTYTLVGAVAGHNLTGTITDVGTGISTTAQFSFTDTAPSI